MIAEFATMVGLLADFVSLRDSRKSADLDEYRDWLLSHRHEHLVELLTTNREVAQWIERFLQTQHSEIVDKLSRLNDLMVSIAARVKGFEAIAGSLHGGTQFSSQMIDVLQQMNRLNASRFVKITTRGGIELVVVDGAVRQNIAIADERFIEDDLVSMIEFGLLRCELSDRGTRRFIITRAGAELAQQSTGETQ